MTLDAENAARVLLAAVEDIRRRRWPDQLGHGTITEAWAIVEGLDARDSTLPSAHDRPGWLARAHLGREALVVLQDPGATPAERDAAAQTVGELCVEWPPLRSYLVARHRTAQEGEWLDLMSRRNAAQYELEGLRWWQRRLL